MGNRIDKRRGRRKSKTTEGSTSDQAQIQADVAHGGLAIFEHAGSRPGRDAALLHVVPADMAHSLRFLLSRLQQSDEVGSRQTIAITSALSGEGVTSVARSLAAILAHDLDRSVCLVETNWWLDDDGDADLLQRPGLADVLTGSSTIEDAVVHTSEPRLALLTSGQMPVADRPAIVASNVFTDVLKLLTKGFDTVIIDAPPVLKASEASMIARHADAAVLVVRRGVTTDQQVEMAIDELRGTELLGVILNRSSTRVPRFLRRFALPA